MWRGRCKVGSRMNCPLRLLALLSSQNGQEQTRLGDGSTGGGGDRYINDGPPLLR